MNSRKLFAFALLLCLSAQAWATSAWTDSAQELASKILALTGPGVASLNIRNDSSIPNDQVAEVRRLIESKLKAGGVQLSEKEAASEVRVTLSENTRNYVWIAEVQQGSDLRTALLEVARAQTKPTGPQAASITLHKTLLFSQPAPILDALPLPGSRVVVLGASAITIYDHAEGKWLAKQSFPIVHATPFPRDIRGRLVPATDHLFDAYLPGVVCGAEEKLTSVNCHESDDPWPLGTLSAFFNSARNFFTGLMRPGFTKQLPPFYSAAAISREKPALWIFAGADNQARILDGVNLTPVGAAAREWGSDLVAVRSACGIGMQLIVSGSGDDSATDSLRVYEIPDREPVAVATSMAFDGPITALWPSADQTSAIAIVHSLYQGNFDAYNVSVSCNQ
jgi:hypothetical protein